MSPQSILAVTDFSTSTDAVLGRAMQLALKHGATLELVYLPPYGDPSVPDAADRLSQHALRLAQRHQSPVPVVSRIAGSFEGVVTAARNVDLVVTGATIKHDLKSLFCGLQEQRLIRATGRPVLVVRREADEAQLPYRRLLVAVDFSDTSRDLVATGFAFGHTAEVELFHTTSTLNEGKLRSAAVTVEAIEAYRRECTRYAQGRMFSLTDSTDARRNRVGSTIGRGDPALQAVVQQQYSGAQLIVVGKHPASAISDFLFGSVSQRVLQYASTDVLVVPHGFKPGTRAVAVRRFDHQTSTRPRLRAGTSLSRR